MDDEADVRFLVKSALKSRGCEVDGSANLKECLQMLDRYQPDYLILDIDLPDGSGLDAIPTIKQYAPQTDIIINSALGTAQNKARAEELGVEIFLTKPLDRGELFKVLEV